jgi:hypothetical protein
MNTALYRLTCPLCLQKLTGAGSDGELVLYDCPQHGAVILSSDGRIWVDELPEMSVVDLPSLPVPFQSAHGPVMPRSAAAPSPPARKHN